MDTYYFSSSKIFKEMHKNLPVADAVLRQLSFQSIFLVAIGLVMSIIFVCLLVLCRPASLFVAITS